MKPRYTRLPVVFFLILIVNPLWSLEVVESAFSPPQFFIGDRVEYLLVVRSEYADQLRAPDNLPESQLIEFYSVDVRPHEGRNTAEIRLSFSAYVPGTISLPAIHLGAESLRGREILVRSLQPQYGSELQETRAQLPVPGTSLALWLISAFVVFVPAVWLLFMHFGPGWYAGLYHRFTVKRPYRRLRKSLIKLSRNLKLMNPREFYIELHTVLRNYFSGKTGMDCIAATTFEIERILGRISDDSESTRKLMEVFHYGDKVKFAGQAADIEIRREHLLSVIESTAVIEQKEPEIPGQVKRHVNS
ncbi:hypothetical protein [Spirochaeta dissipatitropha]